MQKRLSEESGGNTTEYHVATTLVRSLAGSPQLACFRLRKGFCHRCHYSLKHTTELTGSAPEKLKVRCHDAFFEGEGVICYSSLYQDTGALWKAGRNHRQQYKTSKVSNTGVIEYRILQKELNSIYPV